mgnify:CR=1 FL=1
MRRLARASTTLIVLCIVSGWAHAQNVDGRINGFANNPNKARIDRGAKEVLSLAAVDPAHASKELAAFQKEVAEDFRKRPDENMAWLFWRDGRLIHEVYHPKINQDNYFLAFSVTKSVIAMGIGAAVCEGKLSLADIASKHLPELVGSAYADRSIEDLLKMKSGIPFAEDPNAVNLFRGVLSQTETYDATLLSFKVSDYPRRDVMNWNYDSNNTEVLGRVLESVSGGAGRYLSEVFWSRIGAQSDAWFAVDNRKRLMAAGGLYAQPRDYLRIGIHLLNTVDEASPNTCIRDFARKAVSPLTTITTNRYYGYGYQFWSRNNLIRNNEGVFQLNGRIGQRVVVDPKTRVVAVAVSNGEGGLNHFYPLVNKLRTVNM